MKGRRWRSRPGPKSRGYQFHPDQYVTFTPAELAALELPAPRSRVADLTAALAALLEVSR